jgi:hypothetical protein
VRLQPKYHGKEARRTAEKRGITEADLEGVIRSTKSSIAPWFNNVAQHFKSNEDDAIVYPELLAAVHEYHKLVHDGGTAGVAGTGQYL